MHTVLNFKRRVLDLMRSKLNELIPEGRYWSKEKINTSEDVSYIFFFLPRAYIYTYKRLI